MKTFLCMLAFDSSLCFDYVIDKNRDFDHTMVMQPQGFSSISFLQIWSGPYGLKIVKSFLPDELGAGGDDTWLGGEAPRRQLS